MIDSFCESTFFRQIQGDAWGMLRECGGGSCARGVALGNDDVRDEAAMARDKQENEFSLEFNR